MANNERLGASFGIDVTDLKAGLAQANRLIRESNSEFQAAAAGMDDWTQSEEGLTAKIRSLNSITDIQRKKVDALQSEYDRLIADGLDPTSRQAVELRTKINNETAALNKNEAELKRQTAALYELSNETEEAGDAAEEMGDKFSGLKAAGGIAVGAIAAVGTAVVGAVSAFLSLAESTRESRNEMAKLETSFQTAGLSAQDAENTFTDLFAIMGDEGAAVEAAQQLAKISENEKDLEANTRILTGVMAEYGNSIPLEGLAEGIASSAAMSSVQGPLADALEWQGVNLDDFNAKLASMATEEERAAFIQSELTGLYGESADAYRENNAEIIASQEAQAKLNNTINELGAIAEPIMTTIKTLTADLLQSITPFVSLIGEGLAGALAGADGAADTLAEGISGLITSALDKVLEIAPFVIETVTAIIPVLLTEILGQLPNILQTLLLMVSDVAQSLAKMLPSLIPVVIDTVILLAETLLDNIDLIIDAGIALLLGLADGLLVALPRLIEKIPVIIEKLILAISSNLPKLLQMGIEMTVKLAAGLIQAIPQLISKIPQILTAITGGLKNGISGVVSVGKDLVRGLWDGIKDLTWIKSKIRGWVGDVMSFLKKLFGINSPSKVMADEVGKNLALGIGVGFENNIAGVNKDIAAAMTFDDPQYPTGKPRNSGSVGGITQINNFKQAQTSEIEKYKAKQQLYAAARLIKAGAI
jgi:phage-related protein